MQNLCLWISFLKSTIKIFKEKHVGNTMRFGHSFNLVPCTQILETSYVIVLHTNVHCANISLKCLYFNTPKDLHVKRETLTCSATKRHLEY